jgi:hypothetical protein
VSTYPLSSLDLVSAKLSRAARPLDFAVVLTVDGVDLAGLRRGAESARRAFPTSGSVVQGRDWVWQDADPALCTQVEASDLSGRQAALEAFVDAVLDPHSSPPVRVLWVRCSAGDRLAVRFHHCAFDGISAGLWLLQMLLVATGGLPELTEVQDWAPPALRSHPSPVRLSKYAWGRASERLWHPAGPPSPHRRWKAFAVEAAPLRAAVSTLGGPTYNDLLSAAFLETLVRWNRAHGQPAARMGLWLPTNIRETPLQGFGNGSSRIRVYGRSAEADSAAQRIMDFREQVDWSRAHGEWHVPQDLGLFKWPTWLMVPVLRAYIDRPGVDYGSAVFSHMEKLGPVEALLPMVRDPEWVMMLDKRYPVGMAATTMGTHTRMSLTWDPGMMPEGEAASLLQSYGQTLQEMAEAIS